MAQMFEWDESKADTNIRKHGVSFDEASSVFNDQLAVIFSDLEHSNDEEREIIIGYSDRQRLIIVSFTERPPYIRIISARKATPLEQSRHESEIFGS